MEKCLMCSCGIDKTKYHKDTKDGNIHMNDYVKDLGFCGSHCFYKLSDKNRRQIEFTNLFSKLYRK